jgi:carbonic anhydrase
MKKILTLLHFITLTFVSFSVNASSDEVHWEYHGENGPEHWGDLAPEFIQCRVGLNQSPINITGLIDADLPPLVFDYQTNTVNLVNNGHTVQINVESGNFLRVEGQEFELLQFHTHVPSEHRIDGESFLLEVHYVHQNAEGELAVVSVLYKEGEDHPKFSQYFSTIPAIVGEPVPSVSSLNGLFIATIDKSYYRYNGSLTTPPCTEGVRWYVLKEIMTVSRERRDNFNKLIGDDARGPQPINARPVLH